jgi:D-lactate dehydrogenase
VRTALRTGNALGSSLMVSLTKAARAVSLPLPLWREEMPKVAPRVPRTKAETAQAIYFPSCIARSLADEPRNGEQVSLPEALVELGRRAGVPLHIPRDVEGVCCGVPFSSKGYVDAHRVALTRAVDRFWRWSQEGRLPIVIDTSPCAYGVLHGSDGLDAEHAAQLKRMRIFDAVEFAHDTLLPKLAVTQKAKSVAIHPVCSLVKMNLEPKLGALARACSEKVQHPLNAACCGFAGDRGFLVPELTASATKHEAAEVRGVVDHEGWYSSSRTCEIGMSRATGHPYRSILHLLEGATRPAST